MLNVTYQFSFKLCITSQAALHFANNGILSVLKYKSDVILSYNSFFSFIFMAKQFFDTDLQIRITPAFIIGSYYN